MGLLTSILGFPLAPLKGVIRLGELLRDEADRRLHDPAVARRELEEIDEARAAGRLSEEEAAEAMDLVLRRMAGQHADLPEDTERR
ncbi:gas vesicle protein GvpG [Acrocarpospora catenulata]|uniref:gas vesicle protein GvpG n=1 Tax=Acrocarpospora catenulata TaxID=2836182 RepID=UPI001BD93C37|nr:gas vesicle protein GvpG [Acrocarpospora catenulata]